MPLYLAFDVGGTKTAALLADETRVLARASGGSIKTLRVPPSEAAAHLRQVLAALETQSGLHLRGAVVRTCIGSSGMSAPSVREWLQTALREAVGGELLLFGDEAIAIDAAFRGRRGVLVIAGTGSNIVGRAATGELVHTGGWGPALADEGSGHWIGTEALRASFRAIDAGAPSSADHVSVSGEASSVATEHLPPLLRRILHTLALPTLDAVIGAANAPGFDAARLVSAVVEAAREGDSLAPSVLGQAGRDLAGLVHAVTRKLQRFESSSAQMEPPEVAFVGSILTHVPEVRQAMHDGLRQLYPDIAVQTRPTDPLEGALWHARGCPGL